MSQISYDEEVPFLHDTNTDFRDEKSTRSSHRQSTHTRTVINTIVLLITAVSLFVNLLTFLSSPGAHREHRETTHNAIKAPYTPADRFTNYEITEIDTHEAQSPFYSPPGEEFDRVWSELLIPSTIRVSGEELRRANKQSLKLREDDSYLGYLEVYHQLHCVKRLVQIRYPERYPELVERGHLSESHFNHCIEVLRKGIMCSGDTTLNTYKWIQHNNATQIFGVSDTPKRCVNWNQLDDWARSRNPGHDYELLGPDEVGFLGP